MLIASTFHPDWQRGDGERVYEAAPFFMLTFAQGPAAVSFERTRTERAGLYASGATLLLLLFITAWSCRGRLARKGRQDIKQITGEHTAEVGA